MAGSHVDASSAGGSGCARRIAARATSSAMSCTCSGARPDAASTREASERTCASGQPSRGSESPGFVARAAGNRSSRSRSEAALILRPVGREELEKLPRKGEGGLECLYLALGRLPVKRAHAHAEAPQWAREAAGRDVPNQVAPNRVARHSYVPPQLARPRPPAQHLLARLVEREDKLGCARQLGPSIEHHAQARCTRDCECVARVHPRSLQGVWRLECRNTVLLAPQVRERIVAQQKRKHLERARQFLPATYKALEHGPKPLKGYRTVRGAAA
eukprot:scaffold160448_cov27-Tisochrysis_lutea.AAC.3